MSRIYGEIRQLGYVVRDIDKAMRHWIEVLGVGPWYYVDKLALTSFHYRGQPSAVHASIAIANSGRAQIELIQQRNDAPSMYRDFIAAGHEGLQHVSTWPEPGEYRAVMERAAKAGHRIGQAGESVRGPFVYYETDSHGTFGHPGTVMEIAELTPVRRRQFEAIEAAARGWDGTDPIRLTWPR